jgi:anti-anti-sigma factor
VTVAADTPEYRPSAAPATNGRAPRAAGGPLATDRSTQEGDRMGASDGSPWLECRVAFADDTAWVQPVGEVDLANVALVAQRLDDARAARAGHVILDLRGATFVDSTALHLALGWQEKAGRERFSFAVAVGPGPVWRAIEAAGLGGVLTLVSPAP